MFEVPGRMSARRPSEISYEEGAQDSDPSRKPLFSSSFKPRGEDSKMHSAVTAFLDNLPLQYLRFYPAKAAFFLGSICYLIMIVVLLGFLVSSYQQSLREQFISIDKDSGRCSAVEKPMSGLYSSSSSGLWEGTNGFFLSDAIYEVQFSSYAGTEDQFYDDMMTFYNTHVVPLGEKATSNTLSENLVAMMGFAQTFITTLNGVSYTQVFSFSATPAMVFDMEYSIGTLCSAYACCNGSFPTIELEGTTQVMTFDSASYANDPDCMAVSSLQSLGYDDSYDRGKLVLDVDMAALSVALAINLKYFEVPGILEVIENVFEVSYDGYDAAAYVDPRYKGMDPVNCFIPVENRSDLSPFCWVKLTNSGAPSYDPVYALPIINEYEGYDCKCDGNLPEKCNNFDIMAGLLYYKEDNWQTGYQYILGMSNNYSGYFREMNNDALNAMHYASGWANASTVDLKSAFDFCTNGGGVSCNVLSINTFEDNRKFVSEDYYQVEQGNCEDVMTISDFSSLAETPPTVLTEQYYKCYPYYWNAFSAALGISFSLMTAVAPIVLIAVIPLLSSLFFYCLDIPAPQSKYTDGEKNAVAKEFAFHLLCIKDNQHSELPPGSMLLQLGKELKEMSEEYEKSNLIIDSKMRERAASVRMRASSISKQPLI